MPYNNNINNSRPYNNNITSNNNLTNILHNNNNNININNNILYKNHNSSNDDNNACEGEGNGHFIMAATQGHPAAPWTRPNLLQCTITIIE